MSQDLTMADAQRTAREMGIEITSEAAEDELGENPDMEALIDSVLTERAPHHAAILAIRFLDQLVMGQEPNLDDYLESVGENPSLKVQVLIPGLVEQLKSVISYDPGYTFLGIPKTPSNKLLEERGDQIAGWLALCFVKSLPVDPSVRVKPNRLEAYLATCPPLLQPRIQRMVQELKRVINYSATD